MGQRGRVRQFRVPDISIQFEYDLPSGTTMDLRMTDGLENDKPDSRDFAGNIRKEDLFIRDLGYSTLPYLEKITGEGAFFLNRLPAKTLVYDAKDVGKYACEPIDFRKLYDTVNKRKLSHREKILIGVLQIAPGQFKLEKKKNRLSQDHTFIHLT